MGFLSTLFPCLRSEKAAEPPSQPPKPVPVSSQDGTVNGTHNESEKASSPAGATQEVSEESKEASREQEPATTTTTTENTTQSHDLTSPKEKELSVEPDSATAGSFQGDVPEEKSPEAVVSSSENRDSRTDEAVAETAITKVPDDTFTKSSTTEAAPTDEEPVTKLLSTDEANVPDLVADLSMTTSDDHNEQPQQQQQQQEQKARKRMSLARIFSKHQSSQSVKPNLQIPRSPKRSSSNTAISPITPSSSATTGHGSATSETRIESMYFRLEGRKWNENADNDSLYCY